VPWSWRYHLGMQIGGGSSEEEVSAKNAKYQSSKVMLENLGLSKYYSHLKNGLMTDDTIMLWTDASLADCKIPPGPRCTCNCD
jgi:hypothetical protein